MIGLIDESFICGHGQCLPKRVMSDVRSAVCTFTISVIRLRRAQKLRIGKVVLENWHVFYRRSRPASSLELDFISEKTKTIFTFNYMFLYHSEGFLMIVTNKKVCFLFPDLLCFISLKSFEIRRRRIISK